MLASSNSSNALQTITINNASDLAVLVVPSVPQLLSFEMGTFGARASCQSVTPSCKVDTSSGAVSCEGFPSTFVAFNYSGDKPSGVGSGQSALYIQTSNCDGCDHIRADTALDSPEITTLSSTQLPINLYSIWLEFIWVIDGDDIAFTSAKASDAITYGGDGTMAVMLTNCSLSFYNVTLAYYNGSYAVVDETLSNTGLSDGLAGPTRLGHYSSRLIANVEGHAFNDSSSSSVMAFLSQDLARLALGSAAVITNETAPTTSPQYQIGDRILGRYPVWPIIIFLALLYSYSAMALIILIQATIFSRATMIRVPSRRDDEETGWVSALDLTQLRLTSPLSLAATLFASDRSEIQGAELSMRASSLDMFDERPDEERLIVGIGGGNRDLDTEWKPFGVWKRHGGLSSKTL